MLLDKKINYAGLFRIFLFAPLFVNAGSLSEIKQIHLSATIPSVVISGDLMTYSLDGDMRRLDYNTDTKRFNDVWFNVRSEVEFNATPTNYSFIQTYNNLSCYGGTSTDVVEMGVTINNKPIISGRVELNDSDLWYRGSDKYYSDVAITMSSPVINNNTQKWCTGRVSFIVARSL